MALPVRIYRIPGSPAPGSALPKLQTYGTVEEFNRTNSATSLGSTPEGKAWAALRGTWGIANGNAYVATVNNSAAIQLASFDSFTADGVVEARFSVVEGDTAAGLIVRAQDVDNHILINSAGSGFLRVWKRVNGAATALATATSGGVLQNGDILRVELSGSTIVVKKNGVTLLTVTESAFGSVTRHGMAISGNTQGATTRIDRIAVTR